MIKASPIKLRIALFIVFGVLINPLAATTLTAQVDSPPSTPAALLEQVRSLRTEKKTEFQKRLSAFREKKSLQKTQLQQARATLTQAKKQHDVLQKTFAQNAETLETLKKALHEHTGELGETFAIARQHATTLHGMANPSLISMQYPERLKQLNALVVTKRFPTAEELNTLWFEWHRELTATGEIHRFNAMVVNAEGLAVMNPVTRIGNFVAFTDNAYLYPQSDMQAFAPIARQPARRFLRTLSKFVPLASETSPIAQTATTLMPVGIDPSGGAVLSLLTQTPTLQERIKQGGSIGVIILLIGVIGLMLALERLITLSLIRSRVNKQRTHPTPNLNNPLGRILTVYYRLPHWDLDALEHHLDEEILRNIPPLERRVNIIKVLAGIAPLLGLLGTVVGMIQTFQIITLMGSGDPSLMAGGISAALVTTMLGLFVAIPLILSHAIINNSSRRLIGMLEEESAGYVALAAQQREAANAAPQPETPQPEKPQPEESQPKATQKKIPEQKVKSASHPPEIA